LPPPPSRFGRSVKVIKNYKTGMKQDLTLKKYQFLISVPELCFANQGSYHIMQADIKREQFVFQ
jgi:hypothetical protein